MDMNNNPLLSEITLPGVTLTLPSGGWCYRPGVIEPTADLQELSVRPYSAWSEMYSKDPFKIMDGSAATSMIKEVCPAILDPKELAGVDVDAIMVASRIASYGKDLEIDVKCKNTDGETVEVDGVSVTREPCGATTAVKIDMNYVMSQFVPIGSKEDWSMKISSGHIVQFVPIPYRSVLSSMRVMFNNERDLNAVAKVAAPDSSKSEDEKSAAIEDTVKKIMAEASKTEIQFLKDCIMSIASNKTDDVYTDKAMISEFIDFIPSSLVNEMMDKLSELIKPLNKAGVVHFVCQHCGHEQDISVVTDPQVFFSKPSPKPEPQRKRTTSLRR